MGRADSSENPDSDGREAACALVSPSQDRPREELRLEDFVGPVLRYGSILSTALIVLGIAVLVWALRFDPHQFPMLSAKDLAASNVLHTPAQLLSGLAGGDPLAIISLGLLVLIATPVVRVASTVLFFLWRGDRAYLAITTFVLLVLLAGFALGGAS